jgi:hypothetical protein
MTYQDFSSLYPNTFYSRNELDFDNLPEIFTKEDFDKTCEELKLVKTKSPSTKDFIKELNKFFPLAAGTAFIDYEESEEDNYNWHLELETSTLIGDVICVRNINNKCIRIPNIDYVIDAETNTLSIRTKDYINLFSLEDLKDKVIEYRKSYKLLKNSLKLLKMEKDF